MSEDSVSSAPESEISLCTNLLQPSLEASLTSSGYEADDEDSNGPEPDEGDGEVTSAYNPDQEVPVPEESVGEPDPEDDGLWMLATGDDGSSTNAPPAPAIMPGSSRNLRRARVCVEDESQKRARLDASTASS